MDPTFNSSFIPKKSMQIGHGGGSSMFVQRRTVYGPGFFITAVLFTLSILASLGLFAYTELTRKDIGDKIVQITEKRDKVRSEEKLIIEYEAMEQKLDTVQGLIDSHIAVSSLLSDLEERTYVNVAYTTFTFDAAQEKNSRSSQNSEESAKTFTFSVEGKAPTLDAVAHQQDSLKRIEHIAGFAVDTLEENSEENNVTFAFSLTTKQDAVKFARSLDRKAAVAAPAAQAIPTGTTTTPSTASGTQ